MNEDRPRLKLANPGKNVVRESLEGLIAVNSGLRILENENSIFRHDFRQHATAGKVCIVSGGGSGHEPMFTGFVGAGMLTAAVAGPVFTSPPPGQILNTLRKLATATPQKARHAGILVLAFNYTGDRLNFGLAIERFKLEFGDEINIQMMTVADDAATGDEGAGRRGICGGITVLKTAGAMAEAGKSLSEIRTAIKYFNSTTLSTIGVSLGSVGLPGSERFLFALPHGQMEIGLGVHGEAGVERAKVSSCEKIVETMGSMLLKTVQIPKGPTEKVVVIVNNLGSMSYLEMGVICKNTLHFFESQGFDVVRLYCGTFMTSLDMAGFSITLLKPGAETLHWLDEPTTAPFWVAPYTAKNCKDRLNSPCLPPVSLGHQQARQGPNLRKEDAKFVFALAVSGLEAVVAAKDILDDLDSGCGDGDCGACLSAGATGILEILEKSPDLFEKPAEAFVRFASVAENIMGGTSGAVYSLFFNGIAASLYTKGAIALSLKKDLIGTCTRAATEKIMLYGGARRGDRTMVDVLLTVVDSLEMNQSCVEILTAADEAAIQTAKMKAKAGRASYVSEQLTVDRQDAGARAVALWTEAICKKACAYNQTRV